MKRIIKPSPSETKRRNGRRARYAAVVATFLFVVSILPSLPIRDEAVRNTVETISRVHEEGIEENLEPERVETARKEDQSSERADRRG